MFRQRNLWFSLQLNPDISGDLGLNWNKHEQIFRPKRTVRRTGVSAVNFRLFLIWKKSILIDQTVDPFTQFDLFDRLLFVRRI